MEGVSLEEVRRLLEAANAARWRGGGAVRAEDSEAADAERRLDALFRTGETLAVYGTLAPGEPNHHVVAPWAGSGRKG